MDSSGPRMLHAHASGPFVPEGRQKTISVSEDSTRRAEALPAGSVVNQGNQDETFLRVASKHAFQTTVGTELNIVRPSKFAGRADPTTSVVLKAQKIAPTTNAATAGVPEWFPFAPKAATTFRVLDTTDMSQLFGDLVTSLEGLGVVSRPGASEFSVEVTYGEDEQYVVVEVGAFASGAEVELEFRRMSGARGLVRDVAAKALAALEGRVEQPVPRERSLCRPLPCPVPTETKPLRPVELRPAAEQLSSKYDSVIASGAREVLAIVQNPANLPLVFNARVFQCMCARVRGGEDRPSVWTCAGAISAAAKSAQALEGKAHALVVAHFKDEQTGLRIARDAAPAGSMSKNRLALACEAVDAVLAGEAAA